MEGKRFIVKQPLMAYKPAKTGKPMLVQIPAGAFVFLEKHLSEKHASKVKVRWNDTLVTIFLVDLMNRAEER
jgi:hypothetical protein